MCLGDTIVFTCIANGTGSAVWRGDKGTTRVLYNNILSQVVDSFTVSVVEINGTTVVSTATVNVTLSLNGSSVSCGNGIDPSLTEHVEIAG